MSNSNNNSENGQPKISDVAYFAIKQLDKSLVVSGLDIPKEIKSYAITRTLFQHGQHIGVHDIYQSGVDPYKIICWYSFSLIEVLGLDPKEKKEDVIKVEKISRATLALLEGFLKTESKGRIRFSTRTRKFLSKLILQELLENGDHGIGKNGLYASFHCAVETLKCIDDHDRRQDILSRSQPAK